MLAFAISLASAFSWGVSDFLGGLTSRRLPVLGVLAVSQPAGLVLIALMILIFGADPISADKLAIAALAGAASLGGLWAFYAAMAMGTVSVVAPIASLGVVVPVAVGLARGDAPAAIQLIGLVPAIAGVVILSYEENPEHAGVARRSIVLAVLAGLGFGIFFTGLDVASPDRPGWAVLAVRVGGMATVAIALLIAASSGRGVRLDRGAAHDRVLRHARQRAVCGGVDQGSPSRCCGRRLDVPGIHDRARARRARGAPGPHPVGRRRPGPAGRGPDRGAGPDALGRDRLELDAGQLRELGDRLLGACGGGSPSSRRPRRPRSSPSGRRRTGSRRLDLETLGREPVDLGLRLVHVDLGGDHRASKSSASRSRS